MLTQADYSMIQELHSNGLYMHDIADRLAAHPRTVGRALKPRQRTVLLPEAIAIRQSRGLAPQSPLDFSSYSAISRALALLRKYSSEQSEASIRPARSPLPGEDEKLLRQIADEGVALTTLDRLSLESTDELIETVRLGVEKLRRTPSFPDAPGDPASAFSHCTILDPCDVARNMPQIFLWFLQDRWLDLMTRLVGKPVICKGINVRKDVPTGSQTGTRVWHVDSDDDRVGKVIVYLQDVDMACGPFEYISRAETAEFGPDARTWADEEMDEAIPRARWKPCPGPFGTVIVADTAAVLHHGRAPRDCRLAAIATYTSSTPANLELCRNAAFRKAVPLMADRLTTRQYGSIFEIDKLLN